jgi:hypothetical protein
VVHSIGRSQPDVQLAVPSTCAPLRDMFDQSTAGLGNSGHVPRLVFFHVHDLIRRSDRAGGGVHVWAPPWAL